MEKDNKIEEVKNNINTEKNPFHLIKQKDILNDNPIIKGLYNNIKIETKKNKENLGSLYNLLHSDYFNIDISMEYLNEKNNQGIIDEIVNLIYTKYVNDSFFYIPEFCSLIYYKDYYFPIKNYLLDCCVDKIKFSILVYWIISSNQMIKKLMICY